MKTSSRTTTFLAATGAAASLAALALAPEAFAQAQLPPSGGAAMPTFGRPSAPAAPANQNQNNVNATTSGNYQSSTYEGQSDKIWNDKTDSLDFEEGVLQWKGKTLAIGDLRVVRARFERYLAAPAASGDLTAYEKVLNEIESLLSPNRINSRNWAENVQKAWNLLFTAAEFEPDARQSLNIATLVEKTARMRKELQSLQMERNGLYAEKNRQLENVTRHEQNRERRNDEALGSTGMRGTGKNKTALRKPEEGSAESRKRNEFLAESRARLGKTDASMTNIGLQARLEFQSEILSFLTQRRWRHAIIACHFYRQLFIGGAQQLKVGDKQVKELFPISNFVPTIDAAEKLAREAVKDVDTGMKAVVSLYDSGQRWSAFQRMQETFFLGEYEPSVLYFEPSRKETMKKVWREARDLKRMADERDLDGCEDAVKKLQQFATDFEGRPILSRINNARQASDLRLLGAERAAITGDMAGAEAQLSAAAKIWPLNPGIKKFAQTARDQANKLTRLVPEFDDLLKRSKLRDIYERKVEFGLALAQDNDRRAKLENIVNALGEIDMRIAAAESALKGNMPYAAWDILDAARKLSPDDQRLAKARADLTPRASNYVAVLTAAEAAEQKKHYAAALTAWLAARELNQGSELCKANIERLSKILLEQATLTAASGGTGGAGH
ncbi:MAG: hypothetical protein LBR07_08025 [Puniceicoccales bacterium]|jgi:hypothetical protein|nr:hypothetical protein [Puniceicoccales bacterium]